MSSSPGPSARSTATSPQLSALQAALAAEQAAVYGYGVVGAHLGGPARGRATDAYQAHRTQRDALARRISAAGATPTPAAPAYGLPFAVNDPASATRLAVVLEERLADVYANAVQAFPAGQDRAEAAAALRDAAVRAVRWRGSSVPFPGLGAG
ncbi:ferritin-like domain-containing protein [Phaeacidiphilus oryzae]|uniref:ferritin-like domain-containing protein n=1 Tax=Phaeacidiphilus oryzae TaxID=348818 RepID=UPI000689A73D|nr:ferritin-like domain-containing protein [Phaeacidiphilus oryzae]